MDERTQVNGSLALEQRRLIVIEPTQRPEAAKLRVAAYARVSSASDDQLNSFAAQTRYFTALISANDHWSLADIYADEGITGTSAQKRADFQRLLADCRRGLVDKVITKSVSRFARNTKDCLEAIRELKALGIGVFFEKENINTLEAESEIFITMLGAFAQAESESTSTSVRWGIQQAMREGRVNFQYARIYGYERGEDNKPRVIPEQAEIVRRIFKSYLAGDSVRAIKEALDAERIPAALGRDEWSVSSLQGLLRNEKYCGDALLQKTYISDCISRKVIKNNGQLPMYLVKNNHQGIIDRKTFDAVQAEIARRAGTRAASKKSCVTGLACYSSQYALTERLVCGECGTLYRRCTWARNGKKRIVWRCISRLDYGTKCCKASPTLDEGPLQAAILAAINTVMSQKNMLLGHISDAMRMELSPNPGGMSVGDIDRRVAELHDQMQELLEESAAAGRISAYAEQFRAITDEVNTLNAQKSVLLQAQQEDAEETRRITHAVELLEAEKAEFTKWNGSLIRQLVDTVTVLGKGRIMVTLHSGAEIEQELVK